MIKYKSNFCISRKVYLSDLLPWYDEKPFKISDMGSLFKKAPRQWGLRGDPHLWIELCNKLTDVEIPDKKTDFENVIYKEFKAITGHDIFSDERSVFVKSLAHGGMSSGRVVPKYWLNRAIPCLWARANGKEYEWVYEIY